MAEESFVSTDALVETSSLWNAALLSPQPLVSIPAQLSSQLVQRGLRQRHPLRTQDRDLRK